MRRSTKREIWEANKLIVATREKLLALLQKGKKVHIVWDFDGVLIDSRSEDVFAISGFDLYKYFSHEECLLFESPSPGPWILPFICNEELKPYFQSGQLTQDIVTARSSDISLRVHMFCLTWNLLVRWMLFLGHQPKKESYRIILQSLKNDPDCYIFCIDDAVKHIQAFNEISVELGIRERTFSVVAPVIRTYTEKELKEYITRIIEAEGDDPIRVRDPSDDMRGYIVLPSGLKGFRKRLGAFR